jgi:hypothetical protein
LPEEVEGNLGLWEQAVPKAGREGGGYTCEHTEEMRFKVSDGHFSCISTVATRRNQLDFKLVGVSDVILHVEGDFIVEDVFSWGYTGAEKALDEGIVGSYHLVVLPAVHGLEQDGIAIDFDHHHDILVAPVRSGGELSGLVGKDGFTDIVDGGVDVLNFLTSQGGAVGLLERCSLVFCGADVLAGLVEVPFWCFVGLGVVLGDILLRE